MVFVAYPSPVNRELLYEEMRAVFDEVVQCAVNDVDGLRVDDVGATLPAVQAVVTAHDDTGTSQTEQTEATEANAIVQASSIPNWATWDEATALAWFDTNIGNNLPVANLAEANAVLDDMATLQRNLIRLVVALRNKSFPNLQE